MLLFFPLCSNIKILWFYLHFFFLIFNAKTNKNTNINTNKTNLRTSNIYFNIILHILLCSYSSYTDDFSVYIVEISLRWLRQGMILFFIYLFIYFLAYGMMSAKKIPDNQINMVLSHGYSLAL